MKNKLVLGAIFALATAFGAQSALADSHHNYCKKTAADGSCLEFSHKKGFRSGPSGFSNNSYNSIKEILSKAQDDEKVILKGRLTKYIGGDKYEFTDDNNDTITVDLDDDRDWSFISKDMPIEILAEVDKDLMSTKLDILAARPARGQDQTQSSPSPKGFN